MTTRYTPDELRGQIRKMHPIEYEYGSQNDSWVLQVGMGAGMLAAAADMIEELQGQLISGFYEERYPMYEQGAPHHELQDLATAEECNRLVAHIRRLEGLTDSTRNREVIEKAPQVSCFYCCRVYPAIEVVKWTDGGQTAICPHCSVDAVIAEEVHLEQLKALHERWFRVVNRRWDHEQDG